MNTKIRTVVFLFVALIFFAFHSSAVMAGGFGVSPSEVLNNNLVPGSFFEQDVVLVQGQPAEDLNATITVNAGKMNGWIKIENGNNFVIPKGVQQFAMKVDVNVPLNATLGEYKGIITINTSPAGAQKSGVSTTLGADVGIDLNITSLKFSSFSIQNFQIPDVNQGAPLNFVMKIKNDGNVDDGPTKVGLTFFDQYHYKQLGQPQEANVIQQVGSFQTKTISVAFSNNLPGGTYWADVKIYKADKTIVDSKMVFNVVTVVTPPSLVSVAINGLASIPLWVYLSVVAVIIIVVLIVIIILLLPKKRR